MAYCTKCGTFVEKTMRNCPKCGALNPQYPEPEVYHRKKVITGELEKANHWYNIGKALMVLQKYSDALRYFEKALMEYPQHQAANQAKINCLDFLSGKSGVKRPSSQRDPRSTRRKAGPSMQRGVEKQDIRQTGPISRIISGSHPTIPRAEEPVPPVKNANENNKKFRVLPGESVLMGQSIPPGTQMDANEYYRKAKDALEKKDLDTSQEFIDKALRIKSDNPDYLSLKGEVLGRKKELSISLKYFERALMLRPEDATILTLKGVALFQLGDYKASLRCCEMALKIDPDNKKAHRGRAACMSRLGMI